MKKLILKILGFSKEIEVAIVALKALEGTPEGQAAISVLKGLIK